MTNGKCSGIFRFGLAWLIVAATIGCSSETSSTAEPEGDATLEARIRMLPEGIGPPVQIEETHTHESSLAWGSYCEALGGFTEVAGTFVVDELISQEEVKLTGSGEAYETVMTYAFLSASITIFGESEANPILRFEGGIDSSGIDWGAAIALEKGEEVLLFLSKYDIGSEFLSTHDSVVFRTDDTGSYSADMLGPCAPMSIEELKELYNEAKSLYPDGECPSPYACKDPYEKFETSSEDDDSFIGTFTASEEGGDE